MPTAKVCEPVRNKSIKIPLALAAAVALLVLGLAHLFSLRFQSGDVYPPYSTLRSDPLGTKVFYSSLAPLRGLDVKRNIMPLSDLPENGTSTTLLFLGLDAYELDRIDQSSYSSIESWVLSGGRLVLTAHPVKDKPFMLQMDERKAKREKEEKEKKAKQEAEKKEKEKKEGKQTPPAEARDKKIAEKKLEKKDKDTTKSAEAKFDDDWTSLTHRLASISLGKRWGFALEFTKPVEEKPWAVRGDAADAKDLPPRFHGTP